MPRDSRITSILDKLELLRAKAPETFGVESHGYQLALPLSDAAVRAFEGQLGVELPAPYRAFLLEAGASGAGPYYGLLPPDRWDSAIDGAIDGELADYAARPCLWAPAMTRDDATWERVTAGVEQPFQGAITIADQGCAYYVTLVTSGPDRGRVMYVSLDGGVPFFPENPDFLSWYERWVDELLAGYDHNWFGTQMPGDETTLAAAARPADGPRRHDALLALFQIPVLAEDTKQVVALRVRDSDAAIRTTALELAKAKNLVGLIEPHVRAQLTDASETVREAALAALIGAGLPWHDAARAALADLDDSVACAAAQALTKAELLTEDELLVLLASPPGSRRATSALESAMKIASPTIFDAIAALGAEGDPYDRRLSAMLAQMRLAEIDEPSRAIVFERAKARVSATTGARAPGIALGALRILASYEPEALEILIGLTKHPEPYWRFDVANHLALTSVAALPALRALVDDPAMPRVEDASGSMSTSWSVGEAAKKAIAKLETQLAGRN